MPKKQTFQWSQQESGDDAPDAPSRSQRKRDSTALQELGKKLTSLPPAVLATLPISEELRDAVLTHQKLTVHEARRRQLQFIGRLIREDADSPKAVKDALDALDDKDASDAIRFRHIEEQREKLVCAAPSQHAELCAEFGLPDGRVREVASLAARARDEREQKRPPHAFRALFRLLRELDQLPKNSRNVE